MSGNSTLVLVLMVGSRFSSRLRGEPGSGGGDKGSEPARPGRMGQATAVNARWFWPGVGAGSAGRAGTRMAVRAPEASRFLVRVTAPITTSSSGAPAPAASAATISNGSASCRAAFKVQGSGGGTPSAATAQLRGTRRGPGTPGEGECHGGRSPVPVAAEGGGEDRRARGVVTLPGPQISSPVPDGPTACRHPGPTTPEERSAARGHTPVDERARKRGNGHDYLQEVGRRPRHPPIINGIPHASSADAPTMANRRSAGKYFSK